MITKSEVRALALAKLGPRPGRLVWDIGAGSGSVGIECARFGAAVVAVERDGQSCDRIRVNAEAHGVAVEVIAAPASASALDQLPQPDAVFVGGGGVDVIAACAETSAETVVVGAGRHRACPGGDQPAGEVRARGGRGAAPVLAPVRASGRRPPLRRRQSRVPAVGRTTLSHDTPVPRKPIGVVAATAAGRRAAADLAAAWPAEVRVYGGASELRTAFESCDAVVAFLAVGAAVRSLAPVLGHKSTDAAVVCVDESLRHAVAVLGGHHGANELATRLSSVLGCTPVITTASDAAGVPALDSYGADLGFTIENPSQLASVGAALLSGAPVTLHGADNWPLPPLDITTAEHPEPAAVIAVTDLTHADGLTYRPKSLVVGVGASRGVTADEVLDAVDRALEPGGIERRIGGSPGLGGCEG